MASKTEAPAQLEPNFLEEWSERYLEAWNSHDAEAIAAMCAEDVIWEDPALPEPALGRQGVRAFVKATADAFPDFHVEELGAPYISPADPMALSRYRMTGTMLGPWEYTNLAPTARRIDVLGVDEWTFDGELLSHYRTYYDSLLLSRQLGVLPEVGSAADRGMAQLQHLQARFQRRQAARSPSPPRA